MTNLSDTIRTSIYGVILPERPRLLVVDDQPINIQTLNQIFQSDHEVFMATRGDQVLDICEQKLPDLILLDIIMPDMDGIEVCRQLKANPETRQIPVIFVTSQESPDEEARGLEVGAVDFISKPVNPAVVRARVKTQLLLKAQADVLKSLAFIDGLTGIPNRRQFDERLAAEWKSARRTGDCLTVMMIDVDHFKLYNDHYGHQQGDECLQAVANALQAAAVRSRDLVARYGGEEFACLLPECNGSGSLAVGQSLLDAVRNLKLPHETSETADIVTVSVGVASMVPDGDVSAADLLAAADHQLYRAKLRGRNTLEGNGLDNPGSANAAN